MVRAALGWVAAAVCVCVASQEARGVRLGGWGVMLCAFAPTGIIIILWHRHRAGLTCRWGASSRCQLDAQMDGVRSYGLLDQMGDVGQPVVVYCDAFVCCDAVGRDVGHQLGPL